MHGAGRLEHGLVVGSAHHRERAVLRARLATRHGRVDEPDSELAGGRRQLTGEPGRRGGVVDEHRTGVHRIECTVVATDDRAHVGIVPDAHHHELGTLGSLGRSRGGTVPVLDDPRQRLACRAVVDGDVVTGLGEMPGHRTTHDAEPEKCNA